jgi:hypothetical protein
MTLSCTVIVRLVSDSLQSTLCMSSALWFPEDGCSLQSKHVRAVKPIVQLVGNKIARVRQLMGKCAILSGV